MNKASSAELLETLPLPWRLALSYAPRSARKTTLTLLSLDLRLASILRQRSEPLIAQMKLAWWRDRLREERARWPGGEPLLACLADWRGDLAMLVPLIDGWEALLSETFGLVQMREFADGRAAAWQMLAWEVLKPPGAARAFGGGPPSRARATSEVGQSAVERAARGWALADLALNLSTGPEAALARKVALDEDWTSLNLPRALRPLAVFHGLAGRAMRRNGTELLDGPGAAMLALRVGVTGR